MIKNILFFIVVFISNVIQCITGFAGTVLAMPFSIMLIGFDTAKTVLNILGLVASVGVLLMNRKSFNKKEFLRITEIMLIGMVIGLVIVESFTVRAGILYKILGVTVIIFTVIGCVNTFKKKTDENQIVSEKKPSLFSYCILAVSGIVHGMFVCGGPLLIVYAGKRLRDKDEFRATVSAVWIVLNSVNLLTDIKNGSFNMKIMPLLGISIIILFAAVAVGNMIAKRMNKKTFMIITYILMGVSAVSLLVK
ncbi:MAG: sulfite exporter TauE/SafE family protein [Oscillospiraceae bacterium]|nr:sulfite exporter TauE/SafE family protein [Oscillospiraceae bacterium]